MKAEDFGLSDEDAKKVKEMKDFPPTLQLSKLMPDMPPIRFEFLDNVPSKTTFKNKETGQEETVETMSVKDLDNGMACTLWLSSKSLKMQVFKIAEEKKTLKGIQVSASVSEYKHDRFGKTRGYRLDIIE